MKKCDVCQKEINDSEKFCELCKRLLKRQKRGKRRIRKGLKIEALKNSCINGKFICAYSGVDLDTENKRSPVYLTYEHKIPRSNISGNIVAVAAIFNDMKSDLDEEEFKEIVTALSNHFTSAGCAFSHQLKLKYWKR